MLNRDTCLTALKYLGEAAKKRGIKLEIAIYGGAAMILRFDVRERTNDIDVKVRGMTPAELFPLSLDIGEELGLEPGWINTAISIFTSSVEEMADFDCIDICDNLSVFLASPQYLLAMKIMAMRLDAESHDVADINFLLDKLELENFDEILEIVKAYYPEDKIKAESKSGLKQILLERKK